MPRTLTRLRYKLPPPPVAFVGQSGRLASDTVLEQRAKAYVDRQSNPRDVRLQVVVNPRSRLPATGQSIVPARKPYTLRDVVDPEGKATHGEIIYVFRNIKTNQIIYSLTELLNDHHLAQLPFIGKHSKPPALRPDEWTPHCVLTFPTPRQGHHAFKQLRELRKGSMDSIGTASSAGTPTTELKRNLDSVGSKKMVSPKANGAPLSAIGSLKQNTGVHAGSRLRPVE